MPDYSKCIFCEEPVLGKKWVVLFKKKPICCECYKRMPMYLQVEGQEWVYQVSAAEKLNVPVPKPMFFVHGE